MSDNNRISPYYFVIEIDGIQSNRFQKCSGLDIITDVIEIDEGGYNYSTRKFIGETHYQNIVLEKGITSNDDLYNWYFYTTLACGDRERKSGSIILINHAGEEIKRWNFFRAFPCRWIGPNLVAGLHGEYAIEKIEISHEGIILDETDSSQKDFRVGQNMSNDNFSNTMRVTKYQYIHMSYERHEFQATRIEIRNKRSQIRTVETSQDFNSEQEAIRMMEYDVRIENKNGSPIERDGNSRQIRAYVYTYQERVNGEYVMIDVYTIDRWEIRVVERREQVNE